jgi:hypothetical protein
MAALKENLFTESASLFRVESSLHPQSDPSALTQVGREDYSEVGIPCPAESAAPVDASSSPEQG